MVAIELGRHGSPSIKVLWPSHQLLLVVHRYGSIDRLLYLFTLNLLLSSESIQSVHFLLNVRPIQLLAFLHSEESEHLQLCINEAADNLPHDDARHQAPDPP